MKHPVFSRLSHYAPSNSNYPTTRRPLDERLRMGGFDYFENIAGLKLKGSKKWRTALCPLHDETHASFTCSDEGAFKCFSCGASGSSLIDFHKAKFGMNFKEAITDLTNLGVYEND